MPIQIACPSCRRPLRVPDNLIGAMVKCPSCAEEFRAAHEGSPTPTDHDDPHPAGSREDHEDTYREQLLVRSPPRPPRREEVDDEFDDAPPRRLHRDLPPHRSGLILALGVISLVMAWNCGPIGLFVGLPAWVMGSGDLRLMGEGRMDPRGRSQTNTGRILGIIGTVLSLLCVVCYGGYFAMIFVLEN